MEHGKVELLARTSHVFGEGHDFHDPSLEGAVDVLVDRVVQMRKGPRLRLGGYLHIFFGTMIKLTNVTKWYASVKT